MQHVMKWWQKVSQNFNADGIRLFAYIIGVRAGQWRLASASLVVILFASVATPAYLCIISNGISKVQLIT